MYLTLLNQWKKPNGGFIYTVFIKELPNTRALDGEDSLPFSSNFLVVSFPHLPCTEETPSLSL